ncbi:MFS transporter [Xenorhabdus innexi]|uniref:Multidrug resistance protein D n=1 Tax=Xenorhabdus innexi TaxID=290109 RepID=A0A1N6MXK2_9GAMM|nr:MFS transporter [Xenorhabdus innexi]PHM28539.1 multidrug resistance protein D [Xenorhabdus innexi]SIP73507.1 putative Drug:H+ antiporter-1 (DHA1) family protein [Xenorhabdus innexi]
MSERRTILFSCFLLIIGLMAIDFFNPSLPFILKEFNSSQESIKNLIVVYMATLGISQFFYGSISDHYGRKPAVIIGFFISITGLFLSGYSEKISYLYASRIITAFGTASFTVISRAIIVDVFQDNTKLKKAFSYFSMSSQLSPALAPIIGGWIQIKYNWHISFFALATIYLVSLIITFIAIRETGKKESKPPAIFIPYIQLVKNRQFIAFSIASSLIFSYTIGYYSTTPYIFHKLGYNPIENSLFFIIYSSGIIFGSWLLGRNFIRTTPKKLYLLSLVFYSLVLVYFSFQNLKTPTNIIVLSFLLAATSGVTAPLSLILCMENVTQNKGAASALQGALKMSLTGVFMILFDLFHITEFNQLINIFAIFTSILLIIYFCFQINSRHNNKL